MANLILSSPNQHYWNGDGAQQNEIYRLIEKFEPAQGCAENFVGEVVRAIIHLYREFCKNGNCNAMDCKRTLGEWVKCRVCNGRGWDENFEEFCDNCGGDRYVLEYDEEYSLNEFFGNFIKLIRYYFEKKNCKEGIEAINDVQRVIVNNGDITEYNMSKYDRVIDYIVWLVLNDEDNQEPIPKWYKNK